jgi:hypothetical protein
VNTDPEAWGQRMVLNLGALALHTNVITSLKVNKCDRSNLFGPCHERDKSLLCRCSGLFYLACPDRKEDLGS